MFINKPFDELIKPWSLRFDSEKIESHYQSHLHEEYMKRFWHLYLILASCGGIASIASILGFTLLDSGDTYHGWGMLTFNMLIIIAIPLELLVNLCKKLQKFRTIPLGILIFIGSAVGNCTLEKTATIRPGFVLFLT